MDVRLLDTGDTPGAKALWKEAFADSDAFIDWYFKNKVLRGHSLGAFDEGGLVSVLHMVPFTIRLQGKPVPSLMIAGAATKNERRGEGHMRLLLLKALMEMRRRGVFITHLYPFKHSFYERFGWTAVTRVHRSSVTEAPLRRDIEVFETDDYRVLDHIYKRMMRAYDGCVLRGSREWRWRLGELKADGGRAAVLVRGDAAAAYALFYGSHKKADVIEMAYTGEEDIGALLSYTLSQGFRRVNYFLPAETHGAKFGMARVVDAEALLRFFDAEALLKDVSITDDFAPWNNTNSASYQMDIATLAKTVCTGISGVKGDLKSLLKRRELFADRPTCIFEMF